jgi:hypothetical protein
MSAVALALRSPLPPGALGALDEIFGETRTPVEVAAVCARLRVWGLEAPEEVVRALLWRLTSRRRPGLGRAAFVGDSPTYAPRWPA